MFRLIERNQYNKRMFDKYFLKLPKLLYHEYECTQDIKTEKQILNNSHALSEYVINRYFLILNDNNTPLARCILTYYKDDPINAYIGFFESINNLNVTKRIIDKIHSICKEDGKIKIIGPINMSFWIGYRFRNSSKRGYIPYTCEPYNKKYYIDLWKKCGFSITDSYYSYKMRKVTEDDIDDKCRKRYEQSIANGYAYEKISKKEFDKEIQEVYKLCSKLYSKFPGYKEISCENFISLFGKLKYILDYDMTRLVYKDNQLKAFFICIPDFENKIYNIKISNIFSLLYNRIVPKNYVLLYMGVDTDALGLGAALAESIKMELVKKGTTSISALIHENKVTSMFYKNISTEKYEYSLLEKTV